MTDVWFVLLLGRHRADHLRFYAAQQTVLARRATERGYLYVRMEAV